MFLTIGNNSRKITHDIQKYEGHFKVTIYEKNGERTFLFT